MPDLWLPGAVRRTPKPEHPGVRLDRSLPPRCTWHATADRVNAATLRQPPRENVANYLWDVGYWPTLLWDPVDGYLEQAYPADVGGRALGNWNQDGETHIQIEVYFAVGAIRDTKDGERRFNTIAETPCVNLEKILAWTDSFGIPRDWPLGEPNGRRQEDHDNIWNTRAGHYAHAQVPGENHTDPGRMPTLLQARTSRELVNGLNGILVPA